MLLFFKVMASVPIVILQAYRGEHTEVRLALEGPKTVACRVSLYHRKDPQICPMQGTKRVLSSATGGTPASFLQKSEALVKASLPRPKGVIFVF